MAAEPTVAELAAIRWLDANPSRDLAHYYRRNGHLTGHASAGRRGAANRMLYRLQDRGWLDRHERITVAGRAAVAASAS